MFVPPLDGLTQYESILKIIHNVQRCNQKFVGIALLSNLSMQVPPVVLLIVGLILSAVEEYLGR